MKKLLLTSSLIILIPFFIVNFFTAKDEIKFHFVSNDVIRVKDEKTGKVSKIIFEEYIKGVLSAEMGSEFELEALKAQAVAARSYALFKMEKTKNEEYDVVNTVKNQVYLTDEELKEKWKEDYESKINKIKKAVILTKGEYMTYDDQVVEALFFSTSTGMTENSEDIFSAKVPYLRSVSSDDSLSPVLTSTKTFSKKEFLSKLNITYNDLIEINVISKTSTGRVKKIKINNKEFQGKEIVSLLGLRSNCFEIFIDDDVIIKTKGYGHGVGMSQYGALKMAKDGYSYEEILKHYYTGIKITKK